MTRTRSSPPAATAPPARTSAGALFYTIGLDPLMLRALRADFPGATVRQRPPLRTGQDARRGPRPHAVLLDVAACRFEEEMQAIRRAWGAAVIVVGVDRRQPYVRVWRHPRLAEVVELAPGFLSPFLAGEAAPGHHEAGS